ncbi:unnamed protein product [Phaedon cochleariae]|uniref:Cytochrome P450 n=1 Tax=Phaedon cochleariae TaxID=80249 RepID=A0A9P0GI25_PHACE|nr:unnamed protein product [Phaedon cochleariae]
MCSRLIIQTSKNSSLKCLERLISNHHQVRSKSVSVASDSKIEEVSEAKETAPPPEVDVNKYIHSNLMLEKNETKPQESSLSFDAIPGPRSLFLISKFWNSIPKLDSNRVIVSFIQNFLSGANFFHNILCWGGNKQFFNKFFRVYGPVVRLHGAFHSDVVLLSRPEHACNIFQHSNPYPIRSCLECIEKYRLDHKNYEQAGLFFTCGTDWKILRDTVSQPLLNGADMYYQRINDICNLFVQRVITNRNKLEEVGDNFDTELYRWYLESLFMITLRTRTGFLDNPQKKETDATAFLSALEATLRTIGKCEYGFHIWKFVETTSWKVLVKNCDAMDTILNEYVDRAVQSMQDKKDQDAAPFLQALIANQKISRSDIITILMDMVLIGTATTTHTIALLLFHLSKNTRCQKKLREEIGRFKDNVSSSDIEQMSYLHACIKEVLRISPPVPILSRVLTSDVKIMDYMIPKDTRILFASHLNSHRDEHFEEANKFKPERWMSSNADEYNIFATMPFGHGPKSCLAKEFAENQIAVLIFKICRKFHIEYDYGDIQSSHELLASPTKPLKFRFIDL